MSQSLYSISTRAQAMLKQLKVLGVLAVIGPSRMACNKVIPFVDRTAK